jgi:uncharacterized protein (TIGR03067 family)
MSVRVQFLALTVLVLVPFGAIPARDETLKKELANLQGEWRLVRGEENGEAANEYTVKNLETAIKGDQLTFKDIAPLTDKASTLTIKIDPSGNPKGIDLKVEAGEWKGTVLEGIYECKGDELKLCLFVGQGTRNRPVEFETQSGSDRVLFVLKRQAP